MNCFIFLLIFFFLFRVFHSRGIIMASVPVILGESKGHELAGYTALVDRKSCSPSIQMELGMVQAWHSSIDGIQYLPELMPLPHIAVFKAYQKTSITFCFSFLHRSFAVWCILHAN